MPKAVFSSLPGCLCPSCAAESDAEQSLGSGGLAGPQGKGNVNVTQPRGPSISSILDWATEEADVGAADLLVWAGAWRPRGCLLWPRGDGQGHFPQGGVVAAGKVEAWPPGALTFAHWSLCAWPSTAWLGLWSRAKCAGVYVGGWWWQLVLE